MVNCLIVRDLRLKGNLSARCPVVSTSPNTSLTSVFDAINGASSNSKIDTLFVLCHGYAGVNVRARVCEDAGGMGLQLGCEDVLHTNVARWEAIANSTTNIVVYACAAADTEPGNEGSTADGRYLMGALAIHTNANVFAADRIQWYNASTMNFGRWKGRLWQFPPSGIPPKVVPCAPSEIDDVT